MQSDSAQKLNVLLIEDSPEDVRLIQELFSESAGSSICIHHTGTLSSGFDCLGKGGIDLVLLDLSLPDSQGLESLSRVLDRFSDIPIVVLTGLEDNDCAFEAIKHGAQDYLPKNDLNSVLLNRSVRYAVERSSLLKRLEEAQLQKQHQQEINSLDLFSRPKAEITSQVYGDIPLCKSAPDIFQEITDQYEALLEKILEKQIYGKAHHLSEQIYSLGDRLGNLLAGPRDLIDIYLNVIKSKSPDAHPQKLKVYTDEGRILLIELMGRLVIFYRNYFSQARNQEKTIDNL